MMPQRPPTKVHRLEDYYRPKTRAERVGLANAYALREVKRKIDRIAGRLNARLDVHEAREAARRMRGR